MTLKKKTKQSEQKSVWVYIRSRDVRVFAPYSARNSHFHHFCSHAAAIAQRAAIGVREVVLWH